MAASENRDSPLERYISALELIAPHVSGLTAPELERGLDLPKATVNRIVHTLMDSGLIAQSPGRGRSFQLGPRLLNLLYGAGDTSWLERITERPLTKLAETSGQSAFLARLRDDEVRSVNCVAPDTSVRLHVVPGTPMPPHATATAKAILSLASPELRDRIIAKGSFETFTPRSLPNRGALLVEIELTRARGYSIENGEHVHGLASVAMPIPSDNGEAFYAVGLTGPESSIVGDSLSRNLAALSDARDKLQRVLSLPGS